MNADGDDPVGPVEITLTLGEDGDRWVARDEDTGVTTQGGTQRAALENLDDEEAEALRDTVEERRTRRRDDLEAVADEFRQA